MEAQSLRGELALYISIAAEYADDFDALLDQAIENDVVAHRKGTQPPLEFFTLTAHEGIGGECRRDNTLC